MFTGIVETTGAVLAVRPTRFGNRLAVDGRGLARRPAPGDSIAVNGVCLTHAPDPARPGGDGELVFDVVRETLDRSNLGRLAVGAPVNLEASVRPDTPMAGHFVQGHVDALGRVANVHDAPDQWRAAVEVGPEPLPCIVPKGSIAIDGVSLTIADVDPAARWFDVALIPTTLGLTNLGRLKPGDVVNLETDIVARTVVHYLQNARHFAAPRASADPADRPADSANPPGLSADKLRAAGFDA